MPQAVFDFQALPNFEHVAPSLRQFQARDGAFLSYRFYDSQNKDRVFLLLHGSSAHGAYLHALADYLSAKKSLGIVYIPFNHTPVIWFNRPFQYCDGKEILSYSFNLNCSYHPRLPYQRDVNAIKGKFILFVGSLDEANDPAEYLKVMDAPKHNIQIIDGVKHLDIVVNQDMMEGLKAWIERQSKI
jgi:hypothetical protein